MTAEEARDGGDESNQKRQAAHAPSDPGTLADVVAGAPRAGDEDDAPSREGMPDNGMATGAADATSAPREGMHKHFVTRQESASRRLR